MPRNHDKVWDVVISGGGPAGSTLAYRLARAGVNTLIVERARFPRWKPCGGGLQARCLAHLPIETSPVIETTLTRVSFTFGFGDRFVRSAGAPLAFGIRRNVFDSFLLEQAVAVGAALLDGTTACRVRPYSDGVILETTAGSLTGRVLVGADGANGTVSRHVNDRGAFYQQVGLYAEVPREYLRTGAVEDETIRIDWGTLASGYGWIFPKRDTVNVGVGTSARFATQLRRYLMDFLSAERILKEGRDLDIRFTGHSLPTMTSRTRFAEGPILVVGDAAGMVEPLTGDGLSHAFQGSQLAATAILDALTASKADLRGYATAVRRSVEPDIAHAHSLQTAFNHFPRSFHDLFQKNERPWRAFAEVLQGTSSYADLTSPHSALRLAFGGLY
jgi:geranylgeranyl reductase family protein